MKKAVLLFFCLVFGQIFSQTGKVGVNTSSPTEVFHVNGTVRIGSLPTDGTANAINTINSSTATNGTASTSQNQTFTQDKMLVVDKNGVVGKADIPAGASAPTGPTRFISGIVINKFNTNSGGTLATTSLIGGASGTSYSIGTATETSAVGGIVVITGTGYKISQVRNGVYDIQFDTPFTQIYSLNANLYDTGNGTNPDTTQPQTVLSTIDQLQLSYISNSIIRIKTGNSLGNEAGRSFTFSVSGK